jgi:hypothetical protein
VWRRWINDEGQPQITLMFGVPTVYGKSLWFSHSPHR